MSVTGLVALAFARARLLRSDAFWRSPKIATGSVNAFVTSTPEYESPARPTPAIGAVVRTEA